MQLGGAELWVLYARPPQGSGNGSGQDLSRCFHEVICSLPCRGLGRWGGRVGWDRLVLASRSPPCPWQAGGREGEKGRKAAVYLSHHLPTPRGNCSGFSLTP